jgi:hypothetical protein
MFEYIYIRVNYTKNLNVKVNLEKPKKLEINYLPRTNSSFFRIKIKNTLRQSPFSI